jgi:hypothetical protein
VVVGCCSWPSLVAGYVCGMRQAACGVAAVKVGCVQTHLSLILRHVDRFSTVGRLLLSVGVYLVCEKLSWTISSRRGGAGDFRKNDCEIKRRSVRGG